MYSLCLSTSLYKSPWAGVGRDLGREEGAASELAASVGSEDSGCWVAWGSLRTGAPHHDRVGGGDATTRIMAAGAVTWASNGMFDPGKKNQPLAYTILVVKVKQRF